MNEPSPPFEQQELSPDDLAVLRAFTAKEYWQEEHAHLAESSTIAASNTTQQADDDEMLAIFIAEATEDIHKMQQCLLHWRRDEQSHPAHFVTLQRAGHKLRGTAGAVNFPTMSVISHHVEMIAEQIMLGTLTPTIGVEALSQAITVLEYSLQNLRRVWASAGGRSTDNRARGPVPKPGHASPYGCTGNQPKAQTIYGGWSTVAGNRRTGQ